MITNEQDNIEAIKAQLNGGLQYQTNGITSTSNYPSYLPDNSLNKYQEQIPSRIEILIKALGTMVIIPQWESNPETFKKEYAGGIQKPILEGDDRDRAVEVLMELIEQL